MSYYTGKEICQGCKKSGAENPRHDKNGLCENCKNLLNLGKAKDFELSQKYISVRDWAHGLTSFDFHDNTLDKALNEIFKALDNKTVPETSGRLDSLRSQPHGSIYYKIPEKVFNPIQDLFRELNQIFIKLRKEKESLPQLAKMEVEKQREDLFNKGVQRGRDLLFGLNAGEISLKDFEERQKINK
jgi:hypothetical protein